MRTVYIITALFALAFGTVTATANNDASAESQWKQAQIAHSVPVKHYYRNEQYGFGVPIPPNVSAYRDAAPNPNHGVVWLLGYQRKISISAIYDAAEYGSTKVHLDHWLASEHLDAMTRMPTVLAGKSAEQATLRTGAIITKVVAQRRNEGGGILYELTLTTTQADQARDVAMFNWMVGRFKTFPLPE